MNEQIIAVDFDGTLCENKWPEIGEPNTNLIGYLIEMRKSFGAKIILWTCRVGEMLDKAVNWCSECKHTSDITYAKNFVKSDNGSYWEKEAGSATKDSDSHEKSNMELWAEREVEIACKHEAPDRKPGEWDYGCACYESALKAFQSLCEDECRSTPLDILYTVINALNIYREKYIETKDKKYWWQMIQLLPSSYNQKRTIMLNYEVLAGIYPMRKSHKLDEWHTFCDWIEELPYSELITGYEKNEK